MEQFSHDLTLALEETSRCSRRWGMRRRTRSTGNLPCAPLPTEDSSSSQADHIQHNNNNVPADNNNIQGAMCGAGSNSIQSDSDDRQAISFALKLRNQPMSGNFESDSLNENFSPARPNTRRKRKFKRMAIEYETTTPSTPAHSNASPLFPLSTVKKRVLKHTGQENFRTNIFFCGKRKRSYRERYMEYESHKHSSSVPRQSSLFTPKASYLEYRSRNRALTKPCERILPLNKSIVSKIEKISAETKTKMAFQFGVTPERQEAARPVLVTHPSTSENDDTSASTKAPAQKSSSVDSAMLASNQGAVKKVTPTKTSRKAKHRRRRQMKMNLQFDENNFMDCGNLNDFMSSSSLSSSDSEPVFANESDHEGDDELTDWPGNEAMINFASKHDFKRALKTRPKLPQIPQMQDDLIQDDDTLMSTEDVNIGIDTCGLDKLPGYIPAFPNTMHANFTPMPCTSTAVSTPSSSNVFPSRSVSMPIDIADSYQYTKQIESEMSGDTSNNILSSPNTFTEVREIRAGCRRIGGTPGYSIITSVNEQLARFLQDDNQIQLRLFEVQEIGKLEDLAKLYSLTMKNESGCIVLNKTSKTMQSIRVDQSNFSKLYLSDYKRRCYGDDDSGEMAS
uniref:CSON013989 protein n=1 Tax=Culicoides sonorensis TaxID=179676 RepID=A0A336M9A7_CULSO